MTVVKTPPLAIVSAWSLVALCVLSGCGRNPQSASPSPSSAAAQAAASSAEASASSAQASAALATATRPAAGTVANRAGLNNGPPPTVTVPEQAQAAGDEAPQALRAKVNAAKDAGTEPKR